MCVISPKFYLLAPNHVRIFVEQVYNILYNVCLVELHLRAWSASLLCSPVKMSELKESPRNDYILTGELCYLYSQVTVEMSRTDGWEKFSCKSLLITYCWLLAAEHLARGWFCLGAVQSRNTSGDEEHFSTGNPKMTFCSEDRLQSQAGKPWLCTRVFTLTTSFKYNTCSCSPCAIF